jgi:hypothetical protein
MQKYIIQRIEYDRDKVLQWTISNSIEMICLLDSFTKDISPMIRDLASSHRLGTASHSATAMVGGKDIDRSRVLFAM